MTLDPAIVDCFSRSEHRADDIQRLRSIMVSAAEPTVRRYLTDVLCCFAVGAYRPAIVAAWCAVTHHLRLVVQAVGFEIAQEYYHQEEDTMSRTVPPPTQWDGKPLYRTCDRLHIFPKPLSTDLEPLYMARCACAHPTAEPISADDCIRFVESVEWLIRRPVQGERIQRPELVLRAMSNEHTSLHVERAKELIQTIIPDQIETFAATALRLVFSRDRDCSYERCLLLWKAASACLTADARVRRMSQVIGLVSSLNDAGIIDDVVDPVDMSRFVFLWDAITQQPQDQLEEVWQYLDRRIPSLPSHVLRYLRAAPEPYGSRAVQALQDMAQEDTS